jgi:opacity protein-like surface antigen
MTDNQFDEFFRKKFRDYSSKVPGDMWQRIKRKKDKDRRIIILLALLLLTVGGATSYFIFSDKQQNNGNIASSQKHILENNDHTLDKKDDAIITQNGTASAKKENGNLLPKNNITIKNRDGSDNVNYAMSKPNKPVLNISSKERNIKPNNAQRNNESAAMLSDLNLSTKVTDSLASNPSNKIIIKPKTDISAKQGNQKKSMLQKDSSLKNEQNAKTNTITIHEPLIKNLVLDVYFSPDIPFSRTSSTNTAYLQHKDSTSKMQLSYTVGAKLSALFGNHILAKIGLQYSEINEKFNYTNKNAIRTVPVVIERVLIDATGAMQVVLDTSNLMQAGAQYKLTYNHYKSIDVPILIGYETGSDRFKAAINTGIILNIKTRYNGDMLDSSLNLVDIGSNNIYKSNTGISLYFGLGLATRLNNSFYLFTEPYIKYRLSSMTVAHESFTQKINVGGLSFGLRYNFKK